LAVVTIAANTNRHPAARRTALPLSRDVSGRWGVSRHLRDWLQHGHLPILKVEPPAPPASAAARRKRLDEGARRGSFSDHQV